MSRWTGDSSGVRASRPVEWLPLGSLMSRSTNYVSHSATPVQYRHPPPSPAPSLHPSTPPYPYPPERGIDALFLLLRRSTSCFSPASSPTISVEERLSPSAFSSFLFAMKLISRDPPQPLCHGLIPPSPSSSPLSFFSQSICVFLVFLCFLFSTSNVAHY